MPKIEVLVGKVYASSYKLSILRSLEEKGQMTPTSLEKATEIKFSHVSDTLKDLVELKLVVCITPELRKGKIYAITDLGKRVLQEVSRMA